MSPEHIDLQISVVVVRVHASRHLPPWLKEATVDACGGGTERSPGRSKKQAAAAGTRRRSCKPRRAAETPLSRPHGADGVSDTVRVDGI